MIEEGLTVFARSRGSSTRGLLGKERSGTAAIPRRSRWRREAALEVVEGDVVDHPEEE